METFTAIDTEMDDRFIFIGFMGAGKSTLARIVGKKLDMPWVDLDQKIERQTEQTIAELFNEKGEDYFRTLERRTIRDISAGPLLVATGGGAADFHWNTLSKKGHLIYFEAPFQVLLRRINSSTARRPLVNRSSEEVLHRLFRSRIPNYQRAPHKINVDRDLSEIAVDLCALIQELMD